MNKRFDLEAAKKGADILWNGEPAKFLLYVPEADEVCRVIVLFEGSVFSTYENGGAYITMAPRKEKTVGYRVYYRRAAGRGCVLKDVAWEDFANLKCIEQTPGFLRWIDTEWQYDEVEL